MKKISARSVKNRLTLPGAATILVITMLLAQVLGFLRTKLVNANFKLESTDVYFAAFKIPDLFFYILAAGVLSVVLIPILTEHMQKSDRKGVWELASNLMNLMTIVTFIIGIIILVFAKQLMHLVASGLQPEQLNDATAILRLIAFNPLLFTVSGILTGTQQVFGRFFFFGLTPLIYNLCLLASAIVFSTAGANSGGPGGLGIIGLGVGALVGGIAQLAVAFIGVKGLGFRWSPTINLKSKDLMRILRQLPARSLDQGVDSLNSIVETNRAVQLGGGVVSSYENAFVLHTAPVLLIGSSISTAAFPRFAERLAQGRPDLFRKEFKDVLRVLMWVSLPVVAIAYFCRGYLARIIFTKGSPEIALILGFLSIAIFFRIIYTLLSRYFYVQKDTFTPLVISIFAIALNIILVFTLARREAYGAAGLALAQSIVSAAEVFIIGLVIYSRDKKIFDREFWSMSIQLVSATGFTIIAAFVMITLLPLKISDTGFFVLGSKLTIIALVTFSTHIVVTTLFGFDEGRNILRKIKKLIYKTVRI